MQPNPPIRTAEECRALQVEIRELRIAVNNRKQEIDDREETIRQLTLSVSNHQAQIDALTRTAAADTSGYQQSIDGLRTTMEVKDETIGDLNNRLEADTNIIQACRREQVEASDAINRKNEAIGDLQENVRRLYEKVESDTNLIQTYQREQDEATNSIISLQARMIEQHERIERYADDNAVLSQHVRERDARDVEQERVERECIDYIHQNDGPEVCDTLQGDIHRARDHLAPQVVVSHQFVGSVIWVSATWNDPPQTDDNDALPTTLRIELDPIGYTTSRLPPTFKITQGGKQFPVGHRIVHMMRLYMGRCWGRGGFHPPPATTTTPSTVQPQQPTTTTANYLFDTDPRCVTPYVADEGGLIAHLVRYAMLRLERYADFCVVCDRPIQHNREHLVICHSVECDYSFHDLGVGYASVGIDITPGTAPGLNNKRHAHDEPGDPHHHAPGSPPTILMMTHTLGLLPPAHHHAVVCSAGSKGYCAVKEMLQNGVPGNTLLIESGDLCNVESSANECCLIYTVDLDTEHEYADHIPRTVEHVVLYSNCVHTPPSLLTNVGITSIDLSPLSQVTEVHGSFLAECSGLTTLDLRPLSQVTKVLKFFLWECTGLTSLDLSPLSQLTEMHHSFLSGCSGLTVLDMSPLSRVTEVHHAFLKGCSGLTTLDLGGLSQVTIVQQSFLAGCSGLAELDLSPLSQVREVQTSFLTGCSGLTTLDLIPLSQVTQVQTSFLTGCSGLTTLDLSPLSQVTKVKGAFLAGCSGLTTLDLRPLSRVTEIEMSFLDRCTNLDVVNNPPPSCSPPYGWATTICSTTGITQWVRESYPLRMEIRQL